MSAHDVLSALTDIRKAAETHMDERDRAQLLWSEETVTEVCSHKGLPHVKVIPFNRIQEGRGIGADYLWWWLDRSSSTCFGMLVQAKRLTRQGEQWKVDIRHKDGTQHEDLLATARQLEVPAMYGVYTGGTVFRADLPCLHRNEPNCLACRRMAISMISAYQLEAVLSPVDTATMVFDESIALEDLVDPHQPAGAVWDVNLSEIPPGPLRDFLVRDQAGPPEVAKRIFGAVCAHRSARALSAATADPITVPGASLFPEVPVDRGHFRGPYYRHFLQGLRQSPPEYVVELMLASSLDNIEDDVRPTIGYIVAMPAPRGPRRPAALRGLNIDGVVLVTL